MVGSALLCAARTLPGTGDSRVRLSTVSGPVRWTSALVQRTGPDRFLQGQFNPLFGG